MDIAFSLPLDVVLVGGGMFLNTIGSRNSELSGFLLYDDHVHAPLVNKYEKYIMH